MRIKTLTVSEVNNYIKKTLDNDFILNNLSVKGEISNLKYHSSGHIYFSLKDSAGKINCVMFKSKSFELDFILEEGMEVIAKGRCSIYPGSGSLQFYIDTLEKEGLGELHIKFEKLKDKLLKEGYFDEEYKRSIPTYVERVGVVTSETGAVIQDIINVAKRRNSLVDIVLYPAQVQGKDAYKTIIKGLKFFNNKKSVDVIIIGRGGGSIEELWNFNEEELAKEIFNSTIPIISAVGHEVDYTISDFVSDFRASTPSQAAEIAIPLEIQLLENINKSKRQLEQILINKYSKERERLNNYKKILSLNSPMNKIANAYLEVDSLENKIASIMCNIIEKEKSNLKRFNDVLEAHNPINVLKKGYSIIEDGKNNIITSKDSLKGKNEINIILKDGSVKGIFSEIE